MYSSSIPVYKNPMTPFFELNMCMTIILSDIPTPPLLGTVRPPDHGTMSLLMFTARRLVAMQISSSRARHVGPVLFILFLMARSAV